MCICRCCGKSVQVVFVNRYLRSPLSTEATRDRRADSEATTLLIFLFCFSFFPTLSSSTNSFVELLFLQERFSVVKRGFLGLF